MARLAAFLVLMAAWGIGGKPVVVGILIGTALMQIAHRLPYGFWFDP